MFKKFEFWRVRLGEIPIVAPPTFVTCSLFLISTHSKNLIHQALTVGKFKILEDLIEGDPPNGTPVFCHTQVLPDILNASNFEYSAFCGLKANSDKKKKEKSEKKDAKQEK